MASTITACRARRGFTLIELLAGILIIFLLMGLLIAGIRYMSGTARSAADTGTVTALKNGVSVFKQEFGFLPPLVKDGVVAPGSPGPLITGPQGEMRPAVFSPTVPVELTFLRTTVPLVSVLPSQGNPGTEPTAPDLRFSLYSLPHYLMGVLDQARSGTSTLAIDGVGGPRFKAVKRDGGFEKAGRDFNPFFDVSRNARAIFETEPGTGKFELRDIRGVAFRYYRWLHDDGAPPAGNPNDHFNIPEIVGDASLAENVELRSAEYAIVGAGPNGAFGDEALLPSGHPQRLTWDELGSKVGISFSNTLEIKAKIIRAAVADNVVEVGR